MMPRQTRNLLGLVCMALMALATVEAAINGCGDMFLRSSFAEIGISSKGYQNSDCAATSGFHPGDGSSRLGFMYDRYQDYNWATKVGDFSLPGSPEMRFGLTGASSRSTVANGMNIGGQIPTKTLPYETVTDRIGVWVGQVNFLGTTLEVTKQWDGLTFAATGIYITVTVKNVGSSPTSESILYFESHDPDNDVNQGGSYTTTNSVVSNGGLTSDGVPYWQVTARGSISGADTAVYYTSYDTRSSVSSDPTFSPANAYNIINGNKGTLSSDTSIGIAATLGFLNPGESVSYSFYLGFGTPSVIAISCPPTISCPGAVSVACGTAINYATPTAVACPGNSVATTLSSGPAQGSVQNAGSYTAVWSATNSAGTATCNIPITVTDSSDPSASCPSGPIVLPLVPGTCFSSAFDYASLISFSDNCAIDTSRTSFTGPSRVSPIYAGTYTATGTAYDFASRSASCSFTLIVSNNPGRVSCDTDGDGINDDIEGTTDTDGDGTSNYLDLDSDGDGIPDSVEGVTDTDGDGTSDYKDLDSDNDGILDSVEGVVDTDGDSVSDFRDLDSDGDGILDSVEGVVDTDGDSVSDFRDLDSDGDTIPDLVEGNVDTDGDSVSDFRDLDSDNDTILDSVEGNVDTDGDSVSDFRDTDSDADTILDSVEGTTDTDGDGTPNYIDSDSDDDTILDLVEGTTDPDADGIPNYLDLDSDNDTILDSVEGSIDTDGDGNSNYVDLDSDADGILDSVEGTTDSDADGIPNYIDSDSDNDGISDLVEGTTDPDADGIPNYLDLDSDNDTIPDSVEGATDTDGDGKSNYVDLDSDADGIPDKTEGTTDTDGDGKSNYVDSDSDGDGIPDSVEGIADPDRDGIPNYIDSDADNDGIPDSVEGSGDNDGDGKSNNLDLDSDNDGILDKTEGKIDSDGDGVPNYLDLDSDNDGTSDAFESGYPGHANRDNYPTADSDGDGVPDEVDSIPAFWGSAQKYPVLNADGDSAPDYIDLDSDNDGLFDIREKSKLPPSYDTNNDGRVDGTDPDGDGIVGLADTCTCFGGLVFRSFDIVTPKLNAKWLMYSTKPISWSHNLVSDFTQIRIDLVSVSTGARKVIFDEVDIGPNTNTIQAKNWRVAGINTGKYTVNIGLYIDGSLYLDAFISPQFNIST